MVEVQNVVFSRRDGESRREVLSDLNLSIGKNEQVAVVGDSGSGKTTLIHLIGGLLRPDSGSIIIDGQDITKFNDTTQARYRRSLGMIFQHYQLLSVLNVYDNITFQAQLNNIKLAPQTVKTLASRLGIADKLNALPHQLSGGEQQRVGIARAMLNKPQLLLADEPTGNLDAAKSEEVVSLLRQLCQEQSVNLIMVTHSQHLANSLDRKVTIENKRAYG
ncbi:ABC transporter ATP-binding protein [Pseudoalteromonas sp. McH1-7]|uniref:ABC transporter ATP-binding protein n=1 Tax=Pseudoalteromonas TaxID=53246 RepID=UPI001591F6F0|nr:MULTISPECIES: ABC transporter ATP-binding protein [Pseudoalteromonas]MDW7548967.1 ABC transporter ATP-binding protein [Pseudoalteromonas peptidolytica]NUZ11196.1 ABC transporter ATP-binding protein [Pseudoalteromonas sp. McH1-7]USD30333.1 ABC transporter ATP-binding protein [Pseudoalteromonas sp. SCSIO 43201]